MSMDNDLRRRIYGAYLSAREKPLSPAALNGFKSRTPYLQKLIKLHFPNDRNAAILDLGCGHGALIYLARKAGYLHTWGVDRSPEQITAAKHFQIAGVELGNAIEVIANQPDDSLDCIIAFDLIEHLKKNEIIPLADSTYRALKSGGRWIIHTPNAESPFGMRARYSDITHEIAFTRTSLSQIILSTGFSSVDCFEDKPVPHGIKSGLRWLLWLIIRSFLQFYLAVETGDIDRQAIFSQNFLAVALK